MHVNTRKMAVSGLLMAFAVVLIILSGILDFNTLLGGLLAPQKLYCITYAMMGIYVLGVEFLWHFLGNHPGWKNRRLLLILGKLIIFNLMYLPALFLFPKLLFAGKVSGILLLVFAAGGQVALFLFDQAYDYFLIRLWEQVREKLFGRR